MNYFQIRRNDPTFHQYSQSFHLETTPSPPLRRRWSISRSFDLYAKWVISGRGGSRPSPLPTNVVHFINYTINCLSCQMYLLRSINMQVFKPFTDQNINNCNNSIFVYCRWWIIKYHKFMLAIVSEGKGAALQNSLRASPEL